MTNPNDKVWLVKHSGKYATEDGWTDDKTAARRFASYGASNYINAVSKREGKPKETYDKVHQEALDEKPFVTPEAVEEPQDGDRIPAGSRIMYKDMKAHTRGHTGRVLKSYGSRENGGVTIEPMYPTGGDRPQNKRIPYSEIDGFWPKGARNRSMEALVREF